MEEVITQAGQVTAEWLNEVLQREGILKQGEVQSVDCSDWPVLKISYSREVESDVRQLPPSLFLKVTKEGASISPDINNKRRALGNNSENEVAFYNLAADKRSELPMILRCYDATYSAADKTAHLLLHDYSQTHVEPGWTVPIPRHRAQITECTARFHSYWWQHPQLKQVNKLDLNIKLNCQSEAAYMAYVREQQEAFPYFVDFMGDRLSLDMRKLYERTLAALPGFWPKYLAPRLTSLENITLLHGDSHWAQFICPKDQAKDVTYMADMECFHAGLPAADLAYRQCFSWTVEQRQAMESGLITQYLEELQTCGVKSYDFDTFMQDYKLSVVFLTLYFQYFFSSRFTNRTDHTRKKQELPGWWWFEYGCTSGNFLDLNCAELFT